MPPLSGVFGGPGIFRGAAVGSFAPGIITFDWTPEPEEVAAELINTANRLEDRSIPLAQSQQIAIRDMHERFTTESSPDGEVWEPWSVNYEPYARAHNTGILQQTGELRASATSPTRYPITADSVFFDAGGLPHYGLAHHTGAERDAGGGGFSEDMIQANMREFGISREEVLADLSLGREMAGNFLPARPFIGLSFEAMIQITEVFDAWFGSIVNTAFAGVSFVPTGRGSKWRGAGGRFVPSPFG